jgi:hypothetical protein
MSRCQKLLEKARNSASNLRFEEVCKLAECYGWVFDRQNGTSHKIYLNPALGNKPGAMMNFQEKNGKAKLLQVKQLLNAIDELGD